MSVNRKIIGGLIAAATLWLGTTAYIGSNTERYLEKYLEKSNEMYASYGMKASVESFEKGFFTSEVKLKIDFVEPNFREAISQTIKLPLDMNHTIEHGPLFFKEGLGFGVSRVKQEVNLDDYFIDKNAFKALFKEEVKVTSVTTIDFLDNASFSAKSNRIVANIEGDEIHLSPLMMEGYLNLKQSQGALQMFVDSVSLAEGKELVEMMKSVRVDADIKKVYTNGFYLGDFVFDIGSLSMKREDVPFELDAAKVSMRMKIDENEDQTIDMKFKFHGDVGKSKLPNEYASLDKIEVDYALNGATLEGVLAFQDFTQRFQTKQQALFLKLSSSSKNGLNTQAVAELEKLQLEAEEEMPLILAGLLKKEKTNLVFETKMIDRSAKESLIKMNLGYVGSEDLPKTAKAVREKFTKEFLSLLSMDLKVELGKAYMANLPVAFQQELAQQLQMGVMFGVVKDNNSSYGFEANYKPKVLTLNGENRSELLQMVEIMLSGRE